MGEAVRLDQVLVDATALRPRPTCASIQARCGSHAEASVVTSSPEPVAGVGEFGPARRPEPVATPGEFAASALARRIVLRSTPVRRSISRWVAPPRQQRLNGNPQMRLQDVHSFSLTMVRGQRNVPSSGA